MKVKSVVVLFTIAFSVLSPLSVHLTIAHGQTSIGTFDVCHAGSTALSSSPDMPCVSQLIYTPCLPTHIESTQILGIALKLPISAFQEEHPPKI
jgi:hypothetical protein